MPKNISDILIELREKFEKDDPELGKILISDDPEEMLYYLTKSITELLQAQKQDLLKKIEGMNGLVEGEVQPEDYYTGYNQALEDINQLLKEI